MLGWPHRKASSLNRQVDKLSQRWAGRDKTEAVYCTFDANRYAGEHPQLDVTQLADVDYYTAASYW